MDLVGGEALAALEVGQLDDDGDADDFGADLLHELTGGLHGAAGGEQVIDEQDLDAARNSVRVHLDAVGAVLQGVRGAFRRAGEFALLADGDEAGPDGLDVCRRIAEKVSQFLKPDDIPLLEIRYQQGPAVRELLEQTGAFTQIQIDKDLLRHDRVVVAKRASG